MPKVLIVSDSHGWTKEVELLKERYQGKVDQMIHCGDSELAYDAGPMTDFMKVKGNCDYDSKYPEEIDFTVADQRFFVAHGHMHNVKMTLTPITYRASERGATIICHGHSHIAAAQRLGDQIIINPGSIRLPRIRVEKTYAILTWDEQGECFVDFYDLEGKMVKDLSFKTVL